MDLVNLPAPTFTAVDGVTQGTAALVYLAIGAAAWLRAPSDIRTRVFFAFSLANLIVFGIQPFLKLLIPTNLTQLQYSSTSASIRKPTT